ncbi:HET-domain-containing protein [Macroventuria anomochaeta]|uniref:HET-domain-containing protein n=1 Tax=Macroventuria anomochaeta TaxID=301207 RepID=A0ACB6RVX2_9PLEO|nr:HET-domain-containing protein [Macroventuria anomochaeta]KAF2625570.1 HET-domain-containing protein [Macroventuria anomochaeta]
MTLEGSSNTSARQLRQLDIERNRQFSHPSIDSGREEIRLVRICPGTFPDPIHAEMRGTTAFYEYTYTALSYQWGETTVEDDVTQILLNDQIFWVRRNLWEFLNRVRVDPLLYPRLFWIDAICINQNADDNTEKSLQVGMMDRIYGNAHKVICWLGEPPTSLEGDLRDLRKYLIEETTADKEVCALRGLKYLMHRPYWTRMWIVQEVVLARRVTLMCGGFYYDWARVLDLWDDQHEEPGLDDFHLNLAEKERAVLQYTGKLDKMQTPKSQSFFVSMVDWGRAEDVIRWSRRLDPYRRRPNIDIWKPGFDLIETLNAFQNQECTNPLDRLYGLLGLSKEKICTPDYSKSLVDLYADVMRHVLGQTVRSGNENDETYGVPVPLLCAGSTNGCGARLCSPFCFVQHYLRVPDDDVQEAQKMIDLRLVSQHGFDWKATHPWIVVRRSHQANQGSHQLDVVE